MSCEGSFRGIRVSSYSSPECHGTFKLTIIGSVICPCNPQCYERGDTESHDRRVFLIGVADGMTSKVDYA